MKLIQAPTREYRTWTTDSRNWSRYRPRAGDIVIATYPKCGTTWMQRIVGLLIFQDPAPIPLMEVSPWIDRRAEALVDEYFATVESQQHRRFLKTHLPFDGLPIFDEVSYIFVARDGRDALLSWHNFASGFPSEILDRLDQNGLGDEMLGRPFPRPCTLPEDEFHRWLTRSATPGADDGLPNVSFFHHSQSWWKQRNRSNVMLVHFNDLQRDLPGEMRRVARFIDISPRESVMPALVEAAGFSAMRRDGKELLSLLATQIDGGHARFLREGRNRKWEGHFRQQDLDLYQQKLNDLLSPDCARWIQHGGSASGNVR
ncbi:MAG: sulfotransferase domain-containing protein [Halioglobus sp.]